ncbi:DUF4139 domain-containing protein [Marinoscillum sp. MHG1-6]|uniref:DUF4139 domain-containing protein n=1 Tax=Marinoscillum sp. MHG1-6 TaxID=2959627 RepID=UPI0021574808|nr:mucoidy inhibitor MuiA family protein [Marinoscillum sp. MHG1-6]
MKYLTLFALLFAQQVFSQTFTERDLNTSIKEVTVYLQGGLVSRNGKAEIYPGKSTLKMSGLSPHIDEKSIQVKANGNFTVLSVNHKLSYLNQLKMDERIEKLNATIESIDYEISNHNSRLEILKEKQSLLNENKKLSGESSGVSVIQLKQAIDFYDRELSAIKKEEIDTRIKIRELQEGRTQISQEIADTRNKDHLPTGEIEIRIESKQRTSGEFKITYLVANTGWYPKYDVRVVNVEKPLELTYKADVYQNTGVNWDNVKLKLSNGNPNQTGVAPQLRPWYLNYARNAMINRNTYGVMSGRVGTVYGRVTDETGQPLPGATVHVKGTTVGAVTDLNGNYSITLPNNASSLQISFVGYLSQSLPINSNNISTTLHPDVQSLDEVVVVGYGEQSKTPSMRIRGARSMAQAQEYEYEAYEPVADMVATTTIENQTTVEFEVDEPYSIKSNGEKLTVDLNNYEIETQYEYFAVPKLDKDAFLIARIVNWNQYNLLEGEANLYFEDTYVGRSILDARSLDDTLNISLGRDKSIVIGRTKVDDFSKRRTIGSNKVESRGFEIMVRNKKSQGIKLTLFDQIPIAAISDITVTPTELSKGKINDHNGELTWELELKPQQQTKLNLSYEVKYPKYEKVVLE